MAETATTLESIWAYLTSLSLSSNNKRWLAEHLWESAANEEKSTALDINVIERKLFEGKKLNKQEMSFFSDFYMDVTTMPRSVDEMRKELSDAESDLRKGNGISDDKAEVYLQTLLQSM